jgi:hypothetical protein
MNKAGASAGFVDRIAVGRGSPLAGKVMIKRAA